MIKRLCFYLVIFVPVIICSQAPPKPILTVEKIMRDPKWVGISPSNINWSEDGQYVYFRWNPEGADSDSLYRIPRTGDQPEKVSLAQRKVLPEFRGRYTRDFSRKIYAKNGDIFMLEVNTDKVLAITNTVEPESAPRFSHDERKVVFMRDGNLYRWDMTAGTTTQLTDFREGKQPEEDMEPKTDQERWLKQEEQRLIGVLKERTERREKAEAMREAEEPWRPGKIYVGKESVQNVVLNPDERYITFRLAKEPQDARRTIVPDYITESAFTEDIPARTKVGVPGTTYRLGIYDIQQDTVVFVSTESVPGINDWIEYTGAKAAEAEQRLFRRSEKAPESPREVTIKGPVWSDDGQRAVMEIDAQDNKDRWIMLLDVAQAELKLLDRQHDDAWIGGPGISWRGDGGSVGWMPESRRVWFQSEASGYSHLYTVDVVTGKKTQLTRGEFEIYDPRISRDKQSWYFTANKTHPGERHFYRMPLDGGEWIQLTAMEGRVDVELSPDETMLAVRQSTSNRPWELYLQENVPGADARPVTHSLTDEFQAYPWREPEFVTFTARDGAQVYARLYRPEKGQASGAGVIFVHGAGYLQNAHKWWSSYFREYMFHNLLADHGYIVLDIDYRASAGYGRDWRTAIYRHMGGKDLDDQVDGARFLVEEYGVDPKRIAIYGGSYGGFITFMALFTQPGVFAAGAALRPVTDFAHYNHPYTSSILNIPYADSLAYIRSSPIYHAEGLEGALLICHGMVDVNVHFQDVVRLTQRLIELGKENWELAIYPMEGHGFREPSSWTDEYSRIFKLFEHNLQPE